MTNLIMLFLSASNAYNLPTGLLSALCFVESGHKAQAVHHDDGNGDSLGVCQIKLEYVRCRAYVIKNSLRKSLEGKDTDDSGAKIIREKLL